MRALSLLLALAASPAAACPAALRAGASDLGLSSLRENGRVSGAGNDVLVELARRTGCPIDFTWYPRARLWAEYASGRINLTGSSVRTAERDRLAYFLPYVTTRFDLVLARSVPGRYRTLAEFVERSDVRLNLVRGIAYTPAVDAQLARLRAQGRIEVVNDYDAAFRKMASARAAATLAPMVIYERHLRSNGLQERVAVVPVAESAPVLAGAYLSRRGITPAARRLFAETLAAMVADGTVARIYGQYVGEANSRLLLPEQGKSIISAYRQPP